MPEKVVTWQVRNWNVYFEIAQSRQTPKISWVSVPNKHDGKSFRRIARHPEAVSIFCAWNLIVQTASKMPVRGILEDEDGPITAEDLADSTLYPAGLFASTMPILASAGINWLEVAGAEGSTLGNAPAPAKRRPGFTRLQSHARAVEDLVKTLKRLDGNSDAFAAALASAADKCRDLGKNQAGETVANAALALVKLSRKVGAK